MGASSPILAADTGYKLQENGSTSGHKNSLIRRSFTLRLKVPFFSTGDVSLSRGVETKWFLTLVYHRGDCCNERKPWPFVVEREQGFSLVLCVAEV